MNVGEAFLYCSKDCRLQLRRESADVVSNFQIHLDLAALSESSSARRAILHSEAGYIYAACLFINFKPLAVRPRTIHFHQLT